MQPRNNSHFRSGANSKYQGSRGAYQKPFGRPSGGFNRGGKRFGGENIHFSKFINKGALPEAEVAYVPQNAFSDFQITPELKTAVLKKGYVTPTPIQDQTIPHILAGKDVFGIANTGTGKTAAFLIPLLNKVRLNPREKVLIIVPTRELAIQIEEELRGFTAGLTGSRIYSVCCVGGASIGKQIASLKHPYNFIIGTPGRLKDLIERRMIMLSTFNTVVLDEADRMLDMGFVADMRFVVSQMPKTRHTLFFSATLSSDIEKLIKDFLRDPVRVSVKTGDTAKSVDQDIVRIKNHGEKIDVLHELLSKKEEFNKVLIFGRTKHGVENLAQALGRRGIKVESIHGNKNQSQRQRALGNFKDNRAQVLVATDVAARGLDIADVSHVINYDLPATYDDYVHRIGRTGRAGKVGKALTFVE